MYTMDFREYKGEGQEFRSLGVFSGWGSGLRSQGLRVGVIG